MDRIAIIGCGGSGKSHVARELGRMLGIMPVHLDGLYYDPDWQPLHTGQFTALQQELAAAPRWVIDASYASSLLIRLAPADTVIFLDLPATACLRGIAQQRLRHRGGQQATIGGYDRITWNFIRSIIGYRKHMAPQVRRLIADHAGGARLIVLRSRRAVRHYLASVADEVRREPEYLPRELRPLCALRASRGVGRPGSDMECLGAVRARLGDAASCPGRHPGRGRAGHDLPG